MTIFTWKIAQLERNSTDDFVVTCHYRVDALDEQYTEFAYGTVEYSQRSDLFIPFENLTEEIVIGWVQNSLGKESIEESLQAKIDLQKNPPIITGLPW